MQKDAFVKTKMCEVVVNVTRVYEAETHGVSEVPVGALVALGSHGVLRAVALPGRSVARRVQ